MNSKKLTGHSRTLSWYIKLGGGRLTAILRITEDALPSLLSTNSVTSSKASRQSRKLHSPNSVLSHYFERRRVSDQLVEGADEVAETRPRRAVLLPAVQHELVQVGGAVWRRGQPVVLLYSINHLRKRSDEVTLQFRSQNLSFCRYKYTFPVFYFLLFRLKDQHLQHCTD